MGGKTTKTFNQDKGQQTAVAEVVEAVRRGGASPIGLDEIVQATGGTFAIVESCRSGKSVRL